MKIEEVLYLKLMAKNTGLSDEDIAKIKAVGANSPEGIKILQAKLLPVTIDWERVREERAAAFQCTCPEFCTIHTTLS